MASYAESLLIRRGNKVGMDARRRIAASVEDAGTTDERLEDIVTTIEKELSLSSTAHDELKKEAQTIQRMNQDIQEFSDEEQGISQLILTAVAEYSRNPRDIKRYVNSFRFYYFLRSARTVHGESVPSLEQMSRWILLSLRWPGILRWLRSSTLSAQEPSERDLAKVETIAGEAPSIEGWVTQASVLMGLNDSERAWLADEDMLRFFKAEASRPAGERLSASLNKGLW
jgi:hypothetical protein